MKFGRKYETSFRYEMANEDDLKRLKALRAFSCKSLCFWQKYGRCFDVTSLAITIGVGGLLFLWSDGLQVGFGPYLVAFILVGCAHFMLMSSLAEITSALPFHGGLQSLLRCSVGFYFSFMHGIMEAFEYVLYSALAANRICSIFASTPWSSLYSILIFGAICSLNLLPGENSFWQLSRCFSLIGFTLILIYCIGIWSYNGEQDTNLAMEDWFGDDKHTFMYVLPFACRMFVGGSSISLTGNRVHDPKVNITRGLLTSSVTLVILALCVTISFAMVTQEKSLFSYNLSLSHGFAQVLRISPSHANLLSITPLFASCFGLMFSCGQIFQKLVQSNLLPSYFGDFSCSKKRPVDCDAIVVDEDSTKRVTGLGGMIIGSIVAVVLCILLQKFPHLEIKIYFLGILSSCFRHFSLSVGYYCLTTKYANLSRPYKSVFKKGGVAFACIISLLVMVSIVGYHGQDQFPAIAYATLRVLLTIYYFVYARKRQVFSKQEQNIMFLACVINHNNKSISIQVTRPRFNSHESIRDKSTTRRQPTAPPLGCTTGTGSSIQEEPPQQFTLESMVKSIIRAASMGSISGDTFGDDRVEYVLQTKPQPSSSSPKHISPKHGNIVPDFVDTSLDELLARQAGITSDEYLAGEFEV